MISVQGRFLPATCLALVMKICATPILADIDEARGSSRTHKNRPS